MVLLRLLIVEQNARLNRIKEIGVNLTRSIMRRNTQAKKRRHSCYTIEKVDAQ